MEYSAFGFPFLLSQIMVTVVPLLMLAVIGMHLIRTFREWKHNENSPRLSVEAEVVSRRTNVYRRRKANDVGSRTSTTYFATFQFESGDRLELQLQGHEYGLLAEGDKGKLTFQGTRYLGFERI